MKNETNKCFKCNVNVELEHRRKNTFMVQWKKWGWYKYKNAITRFHPPSPTPSEKPRLIQSVKTSSTVIKHRARKTIEVFYISEGCDKLLIFKP